MYTLAILDENTLRINNIIISENNTEGEHLKDISNLEPSPSIGWKYNSSTSTFSPPVSFEIPDVITISPDSPSVEVTVTYTDSLNSLEESHIKLDPSDSLVISNFNYNQELNTSIFTLSTGSNPINITTLYSNPLTDSDGVIVDQPNQLGIHYNI